METVVDKNVVLTHIAYPGGVYTYKVPIVVREGSVLSVEAKPPKGERTLWRRLWNWVRRRRGSMTMCISYVELTEDLS